MERNQHECHHGNARLIPGASAVYDGRVAGAQPRARHVRRALGLLALGAALACARTGHADIAPVDLCTMPGQPCNNAGNWPIPDGGMPGVCAPSTCVRNVYDPDSGTMRVSYDCNRCISTAGSGGRAGGAGAGAGAGAGTDAGSAGAGAGTDAGSAGSAAGAAAGTVAKDAGAADGGAMLGPKAGHGCSCSALGLALAGLAPSFTRRRRPR